MPSYPTHSFSLTLPLDSKPLLLPLSTLFLYNPFPQFLLSPYTYIYTPIHYSLSHQGRVLRERERIIKRPVPSPLVLQGRRTSYSISFIHLLLPCFSLPSSSSSSSPFTLLVSVKKLEISHDNLRHRCCAWATLLHPLQLLQYRSCGIFDLKASFYNLAGDLFFSSCMLPNSYNIFLFSNAKLLYSTHTLGWFLFLLLYTSEGKRIQSDPEKEATTMRVCVFALLWTSGCAIFLIPSFWVPSFCSSHVSIFLSFFFFLFFSSLQSNKSHILEDLRSHTQTHTHGVFHFSFWASADEANCANWAS